MAHLHLVRVIISATLCLTVPRLAAGQPPALVKESALHDSAVNVLAFSADGKSLVSGCSAGLLQVTDVASGKTLCTLKGHSAKAIGRHYRNSTPPLGVLAVAFSLDGRTLFSGGSDGFLYAWELSTRDKRILINDQFVTAIALSPSGNYLASVGYASDIRIIELATNKVRHLKGGPERVTAALFSADGKLLITGGVTVNETFPNCPVIESDWIRTWDLERGSEVARLAGKAHRLTPIAANAFISSGAVLHLEKGHDAIGQVQFDDTTLSNRIETCHWEGSKKTWTLDGHGEIAAISPDGRFLATASGRDSFFEVGIKGGNSLSPDLRENKTLIFDVATRQLLLELSIAHAGALAFDPRGRRLAIADDSGKVFVCDLDAASEHFLRPLTPAQTWEHMAEKPWPFCFRSMWRLGLGTRSTFDLFKQKLLAPLPKDDAPIRQAIADLNSDSFASREAAFKRLIDIGVSAAPLMRRALNEKPPLEVSRRLEKLLSRYEQQFVTSPGETRRHLRAVEILKNLSTPEARNLLRDIADRNPHAKVHDAALAAITEK